jgi:uracil-DNA glycosylase
VTRRDSILREMGLAPVWRLRAATEAEVPLAEALVEPASLVQAIEPAAAPPVPAGEPDLDWETLIARIRACTACRLCQQRKQAVPGVGDRRADWLFVGEGPGAEEDERGEPFVGQAGRLLDNMLAAIGLARGKNVYIANAVKCRPPHNRTPEPDEIATCHPFLERQIGLIAPRLIVALGRPAAQALLNTEVKIGAARGRTFLYRDTPVIVTYHPAYLLRNPHDKAKAWEDLCFARRTMADLVARSGQAQT